MKRLKLCVVITQAPFGNDRGRQGLDLALACAAFDQEVTLIFRDQGLFWLQREQDSRALACKNLCKQIDELALYDVNDLLVLDSDCRRFALRADNFRVAVQCVNNADLQEKLAAMADVWVF